MCTLIGTSTNLIVAARYEDEFPGEDKIGLFGPALYGVPVALLGTAYMSFAGKFDAVLPPRIEVPIHIRVHRSAKWIDCRGGGQVKPQLEEEEPLFETAEPEEAESLDMPRVAFCLVAVGLMIILAAADVVKIDVAVLVVSVLLIATGKTPSNTFTVGVGW